uniref:Uncharacterized protein n=1 Tax=Lepeophtheirus salmonis TaxID=72036 RepID=A0A0K2UCK9_LEPSM
MNKTSATYRTKRFSVSNLKLVIYMYVLPVSTYRWA